MTVGRSQGGRFEGHTRFRTEDDPEVDGSIVVEVAGIELDRQAGSPLRMDRRLPYVRPEERSGDGVGSPYSGSIGSAGSGDAEVGKGWSPWRCMARGDWSSM